MQSQVKAVVLFNTLVLCLATNVGVAATMDDVFTEARCPAELRAKLVDWGVGDMVFKTPVSQGRGTLYRLPTTEIGRWVLVSTGGKYLRASRVDAGGMEQVQWDDQCNVERSQALAELEPTGPGFTDEDLTKLLSEHEMGVVYMWSPHMLLSVAGVNEVRTVCNELGVSYTALLDPGADIDFAQHSVEQAGLPPEALQRAASRDMMFRDMYIHAPSLLLYRRGEIVGPVVPGYRHPEHYRKTIQDRLELGAYKFTRRN